MALLNILQYPDPRLRTVARPIVEIDARIKTLARDMAETMYAAPGIGLAATQVNVHERLIVVDITEDHSDLRILINPERLEHSPQTKLVQEGCLSVPGMYDEIERPDWVRIRAINLDGQSIEFEAQGLLSVCVQHEMDHLDGRVFVDYLSRLKQSRIQQKLIKAQRQPIDSLEQPTRL
ncbi:MAG: peptide deformylase [Proteobacteria bacterium]|jgi:peptide deformylase|nr:peptide deformylase [Pseudomonadota bacterium]